MEVFEGTSGQLYRVEKIIGKGGQGSVYKVTSASDDNLYAIKWYKPSMATGEQRSRLETLVEEGAPRINAAGIEFIWPSEIVNHDGYSSFGYSMPYVDSHMSLSMIRKGKVTQPEPSILARLSYLVCVAMEGIHAAGMAYCDINLKNVVFDLTKKRVIIWDNDNVVVNNADVQVAGVWECMAPEVALGRSKPNAETDLYSIAVLLYYMWMWEHPMDGLRTFTTIRCWDIPAKKECYARNPVFAFHPVDPSNAAGSVKALEVSAKRWERLCPPTLKEAFIKSFTSGVHDPSKRIRLSEWRRLFLGLEANVQICPKCGARNLVDGKLHDPKCFHCLTPLLHTLIMYNRRQGSMARLVVHHGALLRGHHLGLADSSSKADMIVGEVEDHPHSAGHFVLRNRSPDTWIYKTTGGQFPINPGDARALLPASRLSIGENTIIIERLHERT
jgi:serine/threonine protein kinase